MVVGTAPHVKVTLEVVAGAIGVKIALFAGNVPMKMLKLRGVLFAPVFPATSLARTCQQYVPCGNGFVGVKVVNVTGWLSITLLLKLQSTESTSRK